MQDVDESSKPHPVHSAIRNIPIVHAKLEKPTEFSVKWLRKEGKASALHHIAGTTVTGEYARFGRAR